jgi:DNA polymerase elongation subunit (family B)
VDKDQIQLILKIIASASSYGIYIEQNLSTLFTQSEVNIYSTDKFKTSTTKIEKIGKYFNPIMATLITGSARLILAMAESIAVNNGYLAYCDTDSVFVNPEKVKQIQDFFRPLNPYSIDVEMFKIEK